MYLTSEKIEKLLVLKENFQHEKLKEILSRAIENWKNVPVARYTFGTIRNLFSGKIEFLNNEIGCCLIGSSILGMTTNKSFDYMPDLLSLSDDEIDIITLAFDGEKESALRNCKSETDFLLCNETVKIQDIIFNNEDSKTNS